MDARHGVEIGRVLSDVVQPCIDQLLNPGELDAVSLGWQMVQVPRWLDEVRRAPGIRILSVGEAEMRDAEKLVLSLTMKGEKVAWWLAEADAPWTPDEDLVGLACTVYSNLQDFIAESTFGWGELRGSPDGPTGFWPTV
jgi:hypothetical protein